VVAFCCFYDALLGPMFLMHVWLISCGVVVFVFFELDISMILCVLVVQRLVGCVFCRFVCSFVTLRGSSHVHWGLLFACHVVNRRAGVFDVVMLVVGKD
jgi:hypothetical protein